MFLPSRSLPSGISTTGVPPVDTSNEDASTMTKKASSRPVLLPILIPVAIALGVYLVLFHVILPTWRAHRERYRQITSRLPHILQPSTIASGISSLALRVFFPTTYALRQSSSNTTSSHNSGRTTYRPSSADRDRDDDDDDDGDSDSDTPLFTAESGEAMVGFDVPHANSDPRDLARRRRENLDRFAGRNLAYARAMEHGAEHDENNNDRTPNTTTTTNTTRGLTASRPPNEIHPERRLSRELEAGFRDDSDEDEDEEADDRRGVTVGRRSFSAGR